MKNIFLITLIISIFIYGCDNKLPKIKSKEHLILEKNKFLKLNVLKILNLEETQDNIIVNITNVEVNDSGSNIMITDKNSNSIIIYDYESGRIKNFLKITKEFSDLFLNTNFDFGLWESALRRKLLPYSIKKQKQLLISKGMDTNQVGGLISNFVNIAKYKKDEIIISAVIRVMAKSIDTLPQINFVLNQPSLILTDSNLIFKKMLPLGQNSNDYFLEGYSIPRAYDFIYDKSNNSYYVTSKNEINSKYKIFKDLTTVCKYNYNCSKHIIIAHLPYDYNCSKLGYYYNWIPCLLTINNVVYCSYPYSDKVFNITDGQKEAFKLKNIPFNNDDVIEYFANHNLNFSNTDGGLTQKDISNLMPLRVWKIIPMKNTIGVLLSSKNENEDINKSDYYFQEYTLDGKLLHYTRIQTENENGKFYHVSYNKKNNMLLTFRKHKNEGWKMEKAKWE